MGVHAIPLTGLCCCWIDFRYIGGSGEIMTTARAKLPYLCSHAKIRDESSIIEPPRGKTNNVVCEQVRHKLACTVTEADWKLKKKRQCTICVAKTKALISFAVTAKLICAFVFANADCWFSHEAAHILCNSMLNMVGERF